MFANYVLHDQVSSAPVPGTAIRDFLGKAFSHELPRVFNQSMKEVFIDRLFPQKQRTQIPDTMINLIFSRAEEELRDISLNTDIDPRFIQCMICSD
jgi:hypothetical protein